MVGGIDHIVDALDFSIFSRYRPICAGSQILTHLQIRPRRQISLGVARNGNP
jgi:hypothetical protein